MASQLGVGCPSAAPLHFAQVLCWQAFGPPAGRPPSNSACQARAANYVPKHQFYYHLSEVLPGGPESGFAQTLYFIRKCDIRENASLRVAAHSLLSVDFFFARSRA